MKPEDKELLLKDLCARFPYGVKVEIIENFQLGVYTLDPPCINKIIYGFADIKPYLRPMSSMTEEESGEYYNIETKNLFSWEISSKQMGWLNAHHFDYRGLIDKGLAIEVTEENNPFKN